MSEKEPVSAEAKHPTYLGGDVNRVACEPIWETEAREARERYFREGMRRYPEEHVVFNPQGGDKNDAKTK